MQLGQNSKIIITVYAQDADDLCGLPTRGKTISPLARLSQTTIEATATTSVLVTRRVFDKRERAGTMSDDRFISRKILSAKGQY